MTAPADYYECGVLPTPYPPAPAAGHVAYMTGGTWEQATRASHADHRQVCLTGCEWCDGKRQWGPCHACGLQWTEFDDDNTCVSCEAGTFTQEQQ